MAYDLLPKIKFEIVISGDQVENVKDVIVNSAKTGEHGDGVILVSSTEQAFNIANLGKGEKVVN
ncbi:MAG: P-II family nitrogen regulator [Nitrososphaera sp.]